MIRKLPLLILPLALLAGCDKSPDKPAEDAKPAPHDFSVASDSNGLAVVTLNGETQKRIDLQIAPAAAAERPAQLAAAGMVLDPAPLLAAQAELTADQAALDAAAKVAQRARTLYADNENVAQKNVESAEADEKSAKIKLDSATLALRLEWGAPIADLNSADRAQLVDGLIARRVALVRVDLLPGIAMSNLPSSATLSIAGQRQWIAATPVAFAGRVDAHTLGEGLILRVDQPGPLLAPDAAVQALLPVPGEPARGALIPESAPIHFSGRTWIYAQSDATNFVRREVALDTLTTNGWFTTNGVAPGDKLVTSGAALLLSEEQKSQSSTGAD